MSYICQCLSFIFRQEKCFLHTTFPSLHTCYHISTVSIFNIQLDSSTVVVWYCQSCCICLGNKTQKKVKETFYLMELKERRREMSSSKENAKTPLEPIKERSLNRRNTFVKQEFEVKLDKTKIKVNSGEKTSWTSINPCVAFAMFCL